MCERRRTHQRNPSHFSRPIACPLGHPLSQPLDYALCFTLAQHLVQPVMPFSCNVATSLLYSLPSPAPCSNSYSCSFFLFSTSSYSSSSALFLLFYPNSTLTHRKMPIRNVSSEKEKLKLATIFFHAGSHCLPPLALYLSFLPTLSLSLLLPLHRSRTHALALFHFIFCSFFTWNEPPGIHVMCPTPRHSGAR